MEREHTNEPVFGAVDDLVALCPPFLINTARVNKAKGHC